MTDHAGEVMVITGTRKGIGKYLVDYYIAQGFTVIGCSRSPMDEEIEGYEHHCVDVADEKAVQRMVRAIKKKHGKIDVLINNAGIASMNHVLLTPLKTVTDIFSTNVFGTFLFCREVAKVMSAKKYGRIVNFATVATALDLEGEAAYAASKAAVESFTRVMSRELAGYNITVNAVGPTPVLTDLIKGVSDNKMDDLIATQAIKRMGVYEDISNVTDFYIQKESEFITGQVLYLGGIT
ncbi:MAG: SDR family NAD(P)-dependent oxidoreductase [Gammaproteobacteria bacterium]